MTDLIKRVALAIELKMQFKDFGQDVGGNEFSVSIAQLDRLTRACEEAARAAIAECFKWRPIETAPKDGTPIIYFDGRHCIGEAFWQDKDEHPPAWWDEANTEEVEPTHWMPLPNPPEEQKP